ncbi:MAG: hypothetical protein Unbinned3138contig1000_5 [Prokaryotic dsDNA virus sp.]|nr:MAG: hypothetical protein Unbinned3138contig1000_5 [Prokaryotic dsDNA virus sp.]|tara:strand:- start:1207 stop:1434 length:228 start_codon:yes stop_codon:yes gene_type:complete
MTEKPTSRARLTPDERRDMIVRAGVSVAKAGEHGVYDATYDSVADACEAPTSRWTVKHYFPTVAELRGAVSEAMA